MSASMDGREHARLLLDFNDTVTKNSWFLLVYSEQQTISDVCKEIVKRHKLSCDITLHLKDAWLPPWEKSCILKEDDILAVRMPRLKRKSCLQPRKHQRKRKKQTGIWAAKGTNVELTEVKCFSLNSGVDFSQPDIHVNTNSSQTEVFIIDCRSQTNNSVTVGGTQKDYMCGETDHNYCLNTSQTEVFMTDCGSQTYNSVTDGCTQTDYMCSETDHNYCLNDSGSSSNDDSDILNCAFVEPVCKSDSCEVLNTAEQQYFIQVDSIEQVTTTNFESFCDEVKECLFPGFQFEKKTSKLLLYQTYTQSIVTVKLSVCITEDFTCQLTVHGQEVPKTHKVWESLPVYFHSVEYVKKLCERVKRYTICCGNPEECFTSFVPIGIGLTDNQQTFAYHEGDFNAVSKFNHAYHGTIRTVRCLLLVDRQRCKQCSEYRRCLRTRKKRIDDRATSGRTFSHSSFKHTDMTRENLLQKLCEQKSEIGSLKQKVMQLERDMKKLDDHAATISCDQRNDGDTGTIGTKKKKRKHKETLDSTDAVQESSDSSIKVKKKKKADVGVVEEVKAPEVVDDIRENVSEIGTRNNEEEVQSEETTKKRKRIRKHRKKARSDLNYPSCSQNQNDSTSRVGKYKGKTIGKDELFFGALPDKLLSPNYFRHGYRNLNVYQPVPNKRHVFKSDSEEESEVQENTEQYNFLSNTKILEEREQYRKDEDLPENDLEETMTFSENDHDSSVGQSSFKEEADGGIGISNMGEITDRDQTSGKEPYLSNWSDTTEETPSKDRTAHEFKSTDNTGDSGGFLTESPLAPSPTVLARQTLSNGVSVFVRQRNSRSNSFPRELSKEGQLNTEATNISTIFKVPVVPKTSSPRTSQSPRTNMSEKTNQSEPALPSQRPRTDKSTTVPVNNEQICPKPKENGAGYTHPSDYLQCAQLTGKLEVGMVLAYRVLEISLSCTPEVSAYKEAEVLAVDDRDMVTLKNLLPNAEVQPNKFHVEVEDEDGILTNTQQQSEQVTLHTSSLLEARVIKKPIQ